MSKKFFTNLTHKKPRIVSLFVFFASLCVLFLGISLSVITYNRERALKNHYMQSKLIIALNDLDTQLAIYKKMALRLSINKMYSYSTLFSKKYNEHLLLEDFTQYRYSSALTDEMFLYYDQSENIFHINGKTCYVDIYLRNLSDDEKALLMEKLSNPREQVQLLLLDSEIYILIPFRSIQDDSSRNVVLVGVLSCEELTQRIQAISGEYSGIFGLYQGDSLVYSNDAAFSLTKYENLLSVSSEASQFTLYFQPEEKVFSLQYILTQSVLILINILLILLISPFFARRAYQPLWELWKKYQNNPSDNKPSEQNIFEEIEQLIHTTKEQNDFTSMQIVQIQNMLKQQVLSQLLNGDFSTELLATLDKLDIQLCGSYYCIMCISYAKEEIAPDFFPILEKELEQIQCSEGTSHLYVISKYKKKTLYIICCTEQADCIDELSEYVMEVARSYSYKPAFGIGKIYEDLTRIPTSCLESVENLSDTASYDDTSSRSFVYDSQSLFWLTNTLTIGSLESALRDLDHYIAEQKSLNLSVLMQRYMFAEFMVEINRMSKMNQIALSNQSISLLITARDMDTFYECAKALIREYCDKYQAQIQNQKLADAQRVCQYISEHFMDYNISLEYVADTLNLSVATVRASIQQITGKMYKDYITSLRMEYAIKLLQTQKHSVADVSAAVGYSCVSYFIRVFKETTGITPAQYMKESI